MTKKLSIKLINFLDSKDIEFINFITTTNSVFKTYNYIYKYKVAPNCDKYFIIKTQLYDGNDNKTTFIGYNYIAYVKKNVLYITDIINVNNNNNHHITLNNFKDKFKQITDIDMSIPGNLDIINSKIINVIIEHNLDLKFINFTKSDCINDSIVDLTDAKKVIYKLNNKLACKPFTISIDYVFNLKSNTDVTSFSFNSEYLLLCLYNDNKCISSLIIKYDSEDYSINIDSKTMQEYEGNKFNILLRSIIIIISKYIYPNAKYIKSLAVNHVSAYIMISYFKATVYNNDDTLIPFNNNLNSTNTESNTKSKLMLYINKHITSNNTHELITKVELTKKNINTAKTVFDKITNIIKNKGLCNDNNVNVNTNSSTRSNNRSTKTNKSKSVKPKSAKSAKSASS